MRPPRFGAPVCALSSAGVPAARTLPGVHRDEPIEPLGLFHIRGRDDDAHGSAARPDPLDQLPKLAPRQRVDAGRRFVEYQKIGIVDQRAAKAELLPHPARQFLRRAIGERREPGAGEKLGDATAPARSGIARTGG